MTNSRWRISLVSLRQGNTQKFGTFVDGILMRTWLSTLIILLILFCCCWMNGAAWFSHLLPLLALSLTTPRKDKQLDEQLLHPLLLICIESSFFLSNFLLWVASQNLTTVLPRHQWGGIELSCIESTKGGRWLVLAAYFTSVLQIIRPEQQK